MKPTVNFEDTEVAFKAKSGYQLFKAYLLFWIINRPWLVSIGTAIIKMLFLIKFPLIKFTIKKTLFEHFCGGENLSKTIKTIHLLANYNIGTIADYSIEGAKTDKGFDQTEKEIIATIEKAYNNPSIPFSVFKISGLGLVSILEKAQLNALTAADEERFIAIKKRVSRICQKAHAYHVRVLIDAEETWIQGTIDKIALEMMEKFNQKAPIVYNTYQLYLKGKSEQLLHDHKMLQTKNIFLGVKLVRGAYLEKESLIAQEKGYPNPIQNNKFETDQDFDNTTDYCIRHIQSIGICLGTHNENSCLKALSLMDELSIAPHDRRLYFAQLLGMSDHISFNLAQQGYNVAKYVPYGPVSKVLPYLFRRAEENKSIAGQSSREFRQIKQELRRRNNW